MDSILAGLSGADAQSAIYGGAAILALVGFAAWGAKKVAGFFGR
ncbi:capsid protein [Stenotrophomonas sp.]|nr:capsid protein [Stenotrophomonas sp.]